jgi:hypothetical protein
MRDRKNYNQKRIKMAETPEEMAHRFIRLKEEEEEK